MGHAIDGVEGVYNRHRYQDEKASALASLNVLLQTILNPQAKNVVPLKRKARESAKGRRDITEALEFAKAQVIFGRDTPIDIMPDLPACSIL